jgi:hypothetical protein
MSQAQRMARLLKRPIPWGNVEPEAECAPTYTLDRQIDQARADMGETKWQRLQREWENSGAS